MFDIKVQVFYSTYYSLSSELQIFWMHSLNVASPQKILGFDGDEFTFSNLNKMMKIIAKTARNVVDIFNRFSVPLDTQFHFRLAREPIFY